MNPFLSAATLATCTTLLGCASRTIVEHQPADNTEIAFVSDRDGDHEIYLHNLAAGTTTQLTHNDVTEWGVAWSPDGTRLAFASDRDGSRSLYTLNLHDGTTTRLTHTDAKDSSPAWSADGTQIAFVSDRDSSRGEIYVINADGSDPVRITTNDRYEEVPAWSPDGRHLAFGALAQTDHEADQTLQIFSIDLATRTERQLTALPGHNSAPRFSPDGTLIAFYGSVGERFTGADIYIIAPDGANLTNLTNDPEPDWQPDFSADGSRILFCRGPGNPLDIWVMHADGSNRLRLTSDPARDEQPRWRPPTR
ncbi:MAG: DPP IV N-terminal domain-containing protein [Phycisphaerales bacterium JB054]